MLPQTCFSAWIMTIAHRQAVEVMRRRQRESDDRERRVNEARSRQAEPDTESRPTGGSGRVWAIARDVLKADAYEALWLRYAEGCSPQEVARVMGKTSVWVRVTLHRSRGRLAEALAIEGLMGVDTEGGADEGVA